MKRDFENINKGLIQWIFYMGYGNDTKIFDIDLSSFTTPASKVFDKRRDKKRRLKKKAKVESDISRKIEGIHAKSNRHIVIRTHINLPNEEIEVLSEILETEELYFPKIEIYFNNQIIVIPIFEESRVNLDGLAYFPEGKVTGRGFFSVNYHDEDQMKKFQLKK